MSNPAQAAIVILIFALGMYAGAYAYRNFNHIRVSWCTDDY